MVVGPVARSFQPGLRTPNLRFGERLEFRPPRDAGEVCASQGDWKECYPLSANVRIPPDRVGLFEVRAAGVAPSLLAINHNDPPTSDLRLLAASSYRTRATASFVQTFHDEWLVGLALLLIAVMLAEWRWARRGTTP